jgi:excisionase family DNA binding protein
MEIGRQLPPKNWLSSKEAAAYLGVTTSTLYSYLTLRKNRPPFFRLAGKPRGVIRFPRDEFIHWANGGSGKQG